MSYELNRKIQDIIVCPICKNNFDNIENYYCSHCEYSGKMSKKKSIDLRPDRKVAYNLNIDLNDKKYNQEECKIEPLQIKNNPILDGKINVPHHMTKELLSYFPIAENSNSIALDLGCGNAIHRDIIELFGYTYIGLDGFIDGATILGDAHCLPFSDNSIDFILSIAVFEHIQYPHVMIREISRVLKPGGKLIGTVAFMEPFHENSYYHHTHLGLISLLSYGSMKIIQIAPSLRWHSLLASFNMGYFPKVPVYTYLPFIKIIYFLSKLYWRLACYLNKSISLEDLLLKTTGAFAFIAQKQQ